MHANATSILDLFTKDQRLEVPLFQRQYVWTQEAQWAPLWEDVSRKFEDFLAGENDGPIHFLGAMVLDQKMTPSTHVTRRQVIDGQQRLTTLQLFLAAFRDFAREHNCPEFAKVVGKYTENTGRLADPATEKFKVWPTQRDRIQFKDVLESGTRAELLRRHPVVFKPRKRKPEVRPLMVEAYFFFYAQLRGFFIGTTEAPAPAADLTLEKRLDVALLALQNALQVVVIDLDQGDDAQIIFETLNARGQPLLPADLLRNYIFLRAARSGESQDALYEKYWRPFDDPFWGEAVRQGRLIRPRSDLLMQHYLASRRLRQIQVTHLFVEYRHWVEKHRPFTSVAAELEAIADARDAYREIVGPSTKSRLGAFGKFLEVFEVSTVLPLLLAILHTKPEPAQLEEILDCLESYIVRRSVSPFDTKAYNQIFLTAARSLNASPATAAKIRDHLSQLQGDTAIWPRDDVFQTHFVTRAGYHTLTQAKVVYLLLRLNQTYDNAKTEKVTVGPGLSVEHLMPQGWLEHWPLQDGAKGISSLDRYLRPHDDPAAKASNERDRVVQGIGNLTLLTQPLNSAVSNLPWLKKREAMEANTLLPITRSYLRKEKWDESEIAIRARDLAARAALIWGQPNVRTGPT